MTEAPCVCILYYVNDRGAKVYRLRDQEASGLRVATGEARSASWASGEGEASGSGDDAATNEARQAPGRIPFMYAACEAHPGDYSGGPAKTKAVLLPGMGDRSDNGDEHLYRSLTMRSNSYAIYQYYDDGANAQAEVFVENGGSLDIRFTVRIMPGLPYWTLRLTWYLRRYTSSHVAGGRSVPRRC
jgi:hypothetical protein